MENQKIVKKINNNMNNKSELIKKYVNIKLMKNSFSF